MVEILDEIRSDATRPLEIEADSFGIIEIADAGFVPGPVGESGVLDVFIETVNPPISGSFKDGSLYIVKL